MKPEPQRLVLDISWEALLKVLAFVVGLWVVVTLRDVVVLLFGVFIFVAAVNPSITRLQKYMSRILAVSLFYALLLVLAVLIFSVFVPTLIIQVNELIHSFPSLVNQIRPYLDNLQPGGSSIGDQLVQSVRSGLDTVSKGLLDSTFVLFSSIAAVLTGVVLSFYLLLEENNAKVFFYQVLPQHRYEAVYNTVSKISERMGNWVRGQVILMLIIGLANFLLYLALGLSFPLPLGIWAGLCEVVPYIGPTLGLIPALGVAIGTGNILIPVLVVVLSYGLIQQLESHIVVPKLMSKAVGLSPVLVIVALTVGVKLLGLVGALIAVPAAAVISVVVGEWHELRKIWETNS